MKKNGVLKKVFVTLLSIGVIVVIAFLDPNVDDIGKALEQVSFVWIIIAFLATLGTYVSDCLMYLKVMSLMNCPQSWWEGITAVMIGFFYCALTPFQSGGQPMQVVQMRSRGIPVGTATSALTVKFISWQVAITTYGICGFIFLWNDIMATSVAAQLVLYIGLIVNVGLLILVALAFFRPGGIEKFGIRVINFVYRLHIIKTEEKFDKALNAFVNTMKDYRDSALFIRQKGLKSIPLFIYGVLEVTLFLFITYCIYRAFSLSAHSLLYVMLLQSLLTIAVSFIPLPGASIASEGGFYLVFSQLFSDVMRFPAMLLWRLFTYYLNIIVGLVFVIIDGFRQKKSLPDK